MKIVIVSAFYSKGMGYVENCLPRALVALGHEVHVVTSTLNVYGNTPEYEDTYAAFLGPADTGCQTFEVDGYMVHRLPCRLLKHYVLLTSLGAKLRVLRPDVVHCIEIASLQIVVLAALRPVLRYLLFAETHQHMSVVKPYLREGKRFRLVRAGFWLTRTLPISISSLAVERCYAIAPDCMEVARRFYGVPARKTVLQSLGSDTVLFHPPKTSDEMALRELMRSTMGYATGDVLCVYTGRFSIDKNPLLLATAIAMLASQGLPYHGIFVGDGPQREAIAKLSNTRIVAFMRHGDLADLYRAVDVAAWPRQESMSMLDAASSGLPLVVSDQMGEQGRVEGNGLTYKENSVEDMARVLRSLSSAHVRRALGTLGRSKMESHFNWSSIAHSLVSDYRQAGAPA